MELSVIICSHNPRIDYLARVIEGLKQQDLSCSKWELVLVDNGSRNAVTSCCDLSWHSNARSFIETDLGLTFARLRAITEARGDILVFVDDDNVLQFDYLSECQRIGNDYPFLGAWGGQEYHEFEGGEPAEKWKRDFWLPPKLKREIWSNNYDRGAVPSGAGMCIRRLVAAQYAKVVLNHPIRSKLDRSGRRLESCGDFDMAFTACDMGLGVARFPSLRIVHLIPKQRLTDDYLLRLIEGISYSDTILIALRNETPVSPCRVDRLVDHYKRLRMPKIQRLIARAVANGRMRALSYLADSSDAFIG